MGSGCWTRNRKAACLRDNVCRVPRVSMCASATSGGTASRATRTNLERTRGGGRTLFAEITPLRTRTFAVLRHSTLRKCESIWRPRKGPRSVNSSRSRRWTGVHWPSFTVHPPRSMVWYKTSASWLTPTGRNKPTMAANGASVDSAMSSASAIWGWVRTGRGSTSSRIFFTFATEGWSTNRNTTPWTVLFPNGTITRCPRPICPRSESGTE